MRALTHELKSPLTAIGGAAELLHEELPAADRERFVQQVDDQVQRLRPWSTGCWSCPSWRACARQSRCSRWHCRHCCRQLDAVAPLLAQRRLQVRWLQADTTPVPATANGWLWRLSNLLANAIDFAPEGSALELAVQRRGSDHGNQLRDHGPGVPAYALPRLGERFFSTPRPRDGSKGSGLGLAITRQVAVLHGGTLRFEDAAPGLRVVLSLPWR
jgi:two-component system sensor histidine kinase CreC